MSGAQAFGDEVRRIVGPDRVLASAPLAGLTTFGVGGPADWLVDVRSPEELAAVLAATHSAGLPLTVMGGGSNVIIADAGIRGVVLRVRCAGLTQPSPDRVRAEAGVTINGLVRWMIGRGLAGLEAWAGTPGTVGGAVYGNAHYAGVNIGSLVSDVRVCLPNGRFTAVPASEMNFGYDSSRLQHSGEVLVSADFKVHPGDPATLRATARASLAHRKRTQPLALPSAGCIFQNPDLAVDPWPDDVPPSAGALIDRAGLKGRRIGGALVSTTHANFIVSDGAATASDIRALVDVVRKTVFDRFGITLRLEVVFLGEWTRSGAPGAGGS